MNKELKTWGYVVLAGILLAVIISIFGYPFLKSLQAVFGFIYVLFLPGYIVVRCFFNDVDIIEKIGLSFGLSIALVILSILFSNMLFKIPITALSNFLVLLVVMLITLAVKKYEKKIIKFFSKFKLGKKK